MSQDMATGVLRDKVPQVCAQTHVSDGRLVVAPFLNWEALEENESLAIEDLISNSGQQNGELGEFEVILCRGRVSQMRGDRFHVG